MLWVPFAGVEAAMVQSPAAEATPVPITVVPSNRVTVLPASAVPVKVGVVTLVMLSVLDTPVSDAVIRSRACGRAGAVVSMVIDRAAEAALTLPATSVALAVMLWMPFARVEVVVMDQSPAAVQRRCRPRSCRRTGSPCCRPRPCR